MLLNENGELRDNRAGVENEVSGVLGCHLLSVPTINPGVVERLAELEVIIERGLQTYLEIGRALFEIREERLYRAQGFATFEDYCRKRWSWSSRQVPYNYIAAARVAENVQTSGQNKPSLSQAVEIAVLPDAQQNNVVKAMESSGKSFDDVSVREVREIVQAIQSRTALREEDAVSELPQAPVSCTGDLWVLDDHKLLVGDTTDQSDVERLMIGETADLVFTDPPYNVDYEGYTEDHLKIKNDRMSDTDFKNFLQKVFCSYALVVKSSASMYICHSSSRQREFQNALESAGFEIRNQIIWAKNTFAWGFGRYKFQHEPIFYCHVAGQKDPWYGDKSQSTLWLVSNRLHPTMKPYELIERALLSSSEEGDIVADLFGGSGSTLIACERRRRKARLIEVDPRYCDVIVRRWQEYSGKQALLEPHGHTFDQIARERLTNAA